MNSKTIPVAGVLLILLGIAIHLAPALLPASGTGVIDECIVVYESNNEPAVEASLLGGNTANAMRKVHKWRQFDKDQLPPEMAPMLTPVVNKLGIPCLALVRKGKVVATAKLPKTDADLAAFIKSKGGF
jgi:hypothetical protein